MFSLFINQWLAEATIRDISWTFIHSLWQGLAAAAIAALIIHYTKRSSARLRYNLLGAVFILFLLTVTITFFQQQSAARNSSLELTGQLHIDGEAGLVINNLINTEQPTDLLDRITIFLNENASWFLFAWFVFFILKCTKLVAGLHYTYRVRYKKTSEPSPRWQRKIKDLARSIGITQTVKLMESELVKVPAAIGYFKPVILVPLGMLTNLTPEQAEAILLHELAHIRRSDYLINLLQSFIESIFFFNPAITWISSRIREEREACCDDIVIDNTVSKNSYLEALVSFHERQQATSLAMTLAGNKMHLLNRVRRMLTSENNKLSFMEKLVLLTSITIFTAFSFIPKHEPATKITRQEITQKQEPLTHSVAPSAKPLAIQLTKENNRAVKRRVNPQPLTIVLHDTIPTPPATPAPPPTPVVLELQPVPEPIKLTLTEKKSESNFSSTSISTIKEDGKEKQTTIEAKGKDGKTYKIKQLDEKIIKVIVDGKEIPAGQWDQHKELINKLKSLAPAASPAPRHVKSGDANSSKPGKLQYETGELIKLDFKTKESENLHFKTKEPVKLHFETKKIAFEQNRQKYELKKIAAKNAKLKSGNDLLVMKTANLTDQKVKKIELNEVRRLKLNLVKEKELNFKKSLLLKKGVENNLVEKKNELKLKIDADKKDN